MKVLILGGNRFFGRRLVHILVEKGHEVTILNRGNLNEGLPSEIKYLKADRKDFQQMQSAIADRQWDLVYDQICYSAEEARAACELFRQRTQRYVFTSSESVYEDGASLEESAFQAFGYHFDKIVQPHENYQAAKRQAEAVFAREASFPVASVRMSLVVGEDDYTQRLQWHIDRVARGQPIHFPNVDAHLDFISSAAAAEALLQIGVSGNKGPINCSAPVALKIRELLSMIEESVGQTAKLTVTQDRENSSPYGITSDKFMNVSLLSSIGFTAQETSSWMKNLIFALSSGEQKP